MCYTISVIKQSRNNPFLTNCLIGNLVYRNLFPSVILLILLIWKYILAGGFSPAFFISFLLWVNGIYFVNISGGVYTINNDLKINDRIRAKEVRLIAVDGEQIGVIPLAEALKKSEESGLDLVEVAPQANPPVCRIMDYGKYKYEQAKKAKKAKKNQNVMNVKEVQMGVKIDDHDFEVKLKMARKFLNSKDKVKVRVKFRGREMMYQQLGFELMNRLVEGINDIGKVESKAHMEGRNMFMVLTPKMEDNH